MNSAVFVREMAEANVRKAQMLLRLEQNDPYFTNRIDLVASTFRAPFELYRAALRHVVLNGVDVAKTKYRNWIWDLHIAFSVGDFTVFGNRPVKFVTNDKMILDAASTANLEQLVRSFEQYSDELRASAG